MNISPEQLNTLLNYTYSGKCSDYDEDGELLSSIFRDASDMAVKTDPENEDVYDLTYDQFLLIVSPASGFEVKKGLTYQVNVYDQIAWIYDDNEDIHYFFRP